MRAAFDFETGFRQSGRDGSDVLGLHTIERDASAANRAGHQKGSGLDPVRNDVVLRAVQFLDAFDDDAPRAGALDLRAHLVQEIGEIANFRFGRGAFDDGHALRQHGRHHDVVGAENGRPEFAAQTNDCAGELRREDL